MTNALGVLRNRTDLHATRPTDRHADGATYRLRRARDINRRAALGNAPRHNPCRNCRNHRQPPHQRHAHRNWHHRIRYITTPSLRPTCNTIGTPNMRPLRRRQRPDFTNEPTEDIRTNRSSPYNIPPTAPRGRLLARSAPRRRPASLGLAATSSPSRATLPRRGERSGSGGGGICG